MARLPSGIWLIQQIGGMVSLFHEHTEETIVQFDPNDEDATAKAQKTIHDSELLDDEDKCFSHFWCGYFYRNHMKKDLSFGNEA